MENLKDRAFETHNEITIRDGRKLIVIGSRLLDANGYNISNKKDYKSNLTVEDKGLEEFDIMRVYNPITNEVVYDRNAVDWTKVAVDTKVLVSQDGIDWSYRYFAKYVNGIVWAFSHGSTSWSNECDSCCDWKYAKLAESEVK